RAQVPPETPRVPRSTPLPPPGGCDRVLLFRYPDVYRDRFRGRIGMPAMRALSAGAIALVLYGWFAAAPVSACQQDALGGKTCFALAALHGGPGEDLNFCEDSQDWVTFNACAGRSYVIATSALGSAADTVLEVYGPDCSTLIASDDNGGGGLQSRIHWITPATAPITCTHGRPTGRSAR